MDAVDEQWAAATRYAAQVAGYFQRFSVVEAVLAGAVDGLTKDQLAERIKPLMEQSRDDFDADVTRIRREIIAATTTRARMQ